VLIVIHISVNSSSLLQLLDVGLLFVRLVPTVTTHLDNIDSYKWPLVWLLVT